jgi:hypothetical protein
MLTGARQMVRLPLALASPETIRESADLLTGRATGIPFRTILGFFSTETHSLSAAQVARMKPSPVLVSFALLMFASLTCLLPACSSSPLTGAPEADGATGAATPSGSTASVGSTGPTSTFAAYPAGPYGTGRGAVIQNLSFLGWMHPDQAKYDSTQFQTLRLSDFYDPDGHTDVKLLAVNASAVWCSVCRAEYEDMNTNGTYATYRAKGVEFLGTLFEDQSYYPAQPVDLSRWGDDSEHAVKFPLGLDPSFKMGAYFGSDATPLNMVIDVRTMTILSVTMGYSTTYWDSVQTLLNQL